MPHKPMLKAAELVAHLQSEGITFKIMSAADAQHYLQQNNNYFQLNAFTRNYSTYTDGAQKGKFECLDFACLIELTQIDMEVRHQLLKMCLDIEHALKLDLLRAVDFNIQKGSGEDGYKIVNDFLTDYGNRSIEDRVDNISKRASALSRKMRQNQNNPYCEDLLTRYRDEMPIWAFIEVISFRDLEELIDHYCRKTGWNLPVDRRSLYRVRQIRNAAAHNNCLLNDLRSQITAANANSSNAPGFITNFVSRAAIEKTARRKKLSNRRINQIVHLLYVYDNLITCEYTRSMRLFELHDLMNNRILLHQEYFQSNALLVSTYDFFNKIVNTIKIKQD